MSNVIPVADSGALLQCPPGALRDGWSANGWLRETKGNDCYMEYSFQGTGVSVQVLSYWDHGPYSCQLDSEDPQWFNANAPDAVFGVGCRIAGIANQQHTLRVTNAPISGFYLSVGNITVTQGDQYNGTKEFTSTWPPYVFPPSFSRQTSTHSVPVKVFAPVTAVLATLCLASAIAAIYLTLRRKSSSSDSTQRWRRRWSPDNGAGSDIESRPRNDNAKGDSQGLPHTTPFKPPEDLDNKIKEAPAIDVGAAGGRA